MLDKCVSYAESHEEVSVRHCLVYFSTYFYLLNRTIQLHITGRSMLIDNTAFPVKRFGKSMHFNSYSSTNNVIFCLVGKCSVNLSLFSSHSVCLSTSPPLPLVYMRLFLITQFFISMYSVHKYLFIFLTTVFIYKVRELTSTSLEYLCSHYSIT